MVLSAERQERAHQETDRPQPHVSVERTQPHASVERTQPHVSVERTPPHVSVERTQPHASVERTQPHVSVERTQPHASVERTQPHASVERTVTCNEELHVVRASYSSRCACVERKECAYVCTCMCVYVYCSQREGRGSGEEAVLHQQRTETTHAAHRSAKKTESPELITVYGLLKNSYACSFFYGKSDCLGCSVLPFLVVCMTLPASFFLLSSPL